MFRLQVENENRDKIELTNSMFYDVIEIDGLLPQKATITKTDFVNNDGSILNSAKIETRDIAITIKPKIPVEENRQRLYKYFRVKKEIMIYFENENRNVKIKGIVENVDGSLFTQSQTIVINIICMKPFFEDRNIKKDDMSTTEDLFEFPFMIEKEGVEFSRINKELTKEILNDGDTETGVIIELTANGEVVKPIIYNVETREYFGLNITLQSGDVVTINTNNFNKKVELLRYGETRNIINNIVKGNKWFKLNPGYNTFTYQCEEGEENLNITFTYTNLYEGV